MTKDINWSFRISQQDLDELKRMAAEQGTTTAGFILARCLNRTPPQLTEVERRLAAIERRLDALDRQAGLGAWD